MRVACGTQRTAVCHLDVLVKRTALFHKLLQLGLRCPVHQPVIVGDCTIRNGSWLKTTGKVLKQEDTVASRHCGNLLWC